MQDIATKGDVAALRGEMASIRTELKSDVAILRGEMASMRTELKGDIAVVRGDIEAVRTAMTSLASDLTVKIYTVGLAVVALVVAAQKLLP